MSCFTPAVIFNTSYEITYDIQLPMAAPILALCSLWYPFVLQFADSWSATIAQSTSRTENGPSVWDTTDTSEISPAMRTMRGVVGSLTSFILSPSRDTSQGKLQVACLLFMHSWWFSVLCSSVLIFRDNKKKIKQLPFLQKSYKFYPLHEEWRHNQILLLLRRQDLRTCPYIN